MVVINFYHDDHMMLINNHNDYSIVHFKSPHQVPVLRKVLSIKDVDCVPENQPVQDSQANLIRNWGSGLTLSGSWRLDSLLLKMYYKRAI